MVTLEHRGFRSAKRGHRRALTDKLKKNAKRLYQYIMVKRVIKNKIGPPKD